MTASKHAPGCSSPWLLHLNDDTNPPTVTIDPNAQYRRIGEHDYELRCGDVSIRGGDIITPTGDCYYIADLIEETA